MTFTDFNLKSQIMKAIEQAGFKEPSPIQKEAIPVVLAGKDMVGQAHTGTGKTAAFALPILNMLELDGEAEALVIVPTRELATQVSDEIFRLGKYLGIKTATVYGGSSYSRQINHIANAAVVVATPGRLLDLLKSGKIELNPKFVVLDEADEMLDMGFLDDIKAIFNYLPTNRQTLLFSATMPQAIKELAQQILHSPEFISITKKDITNVNIKQFYYVVDEHERDEALIRLLDYKNPTKSIIFCRMKIEVDRLAQFLEAQGYSAKGLHGDMQQRQREETIKAFKRGNIEILIATDVAARGLDISDVSHVFNYHIPFDPESYVHRIGRTGRAGREGIAISLVTPHEFKQLLRIQKEVGSSLINKEIPTSAEVKNEKQKSILDAILSQEVSKEAIELVELLESQLDISTATLKLASMVIKNDAVSGSEKIGKSLKEIEKMLEQAKRELSRPQRGGGRNSRSYRGNRRGRSSHRR
ncbi:ATP-dependent RNA helicase DeaD [Nitratiruptor sp. YY08-26]|uniref:DEAD/DEAH box helicase n=1 Tax=unclassified Nitratiruptor TaxID=2624044 RepID=UPI0019150F2E|nr:MULTISPECIES: DEAD/DEAH box helicase [unclassified Nitratiruptor]BCD63021.1 ATP-dependent RNA helicase DeaD [Nitratiruptor sp. YY08-13]BCD66956.1 ATP-dependent RNA helicase DeaD [Nitratiruptor sp. YY08-26]